MIEKRVVTFFSKVNAFFVRDSVFKGHAFFNLQGYFMKKVTFCGHGDLYGVDNEIFRNSLYEEIEKQIKLGATEFLLGGYGQFDSLCARTVKKLKEKYAHIKSVLVIPYLDRKYDYLDLYDCTEYPPIEKTPKRCAILKRNEYMVEKSEVIIAFVEHSWGGAAKTLEYAKRKKKTIIELKRI